MKTDVVSELVPSHFFEIVEYIEAKAILRIDVEQGIKIAACDVKTKDEFTLEDVPLPVEWKIIDVLKENNKVFTCVIKTEYKQNSTRIRQLFDMGDYTNLRKLFGSDIIFELPFNVSEGKVVMTFVADNETIKKLLKKISLVGTIENISFQPAIFSDYNILSCLTERQKEVITTAKESGYYEVPRRISTEELSQKLGISTATVLEHLRKAEHRIMSHILAGHDKGVI